MKSLVEETMITGKNGKSEMKPRAQRKPKRKAPDLKAENE